MRNTLVLLWFALACLVITEAAVFQRGDKISEQFKQLNLAPEEIDPDVAPPPPNKIESFDETSDDIYVNNDNEILDEADNEIIDESINEISQSAVTSAPVAATTVAVAAAAATETSTPAKVEEGPTGLAKYCKCKGNHCDCCREFNLPFIPVKGPGCARMSYLGNQKMSVSLKYGDLTLASRTVSGKRARPICVGLPGGYSQFCGRVYGLSKAKEDFKACLGFELRADDEIEAALRVSCFSFGSEGLRVADAEPFPVELNKEEDDEDDDIFGFGGGGDDEDDEDEYDEDEDEDDDADTDADYSDDEAEEDAPADADYAGFSLAGFLDELDDDDDEESKPSATPSITSLASAVVSGSVTRNAADSAQSKDVKGTEDATAPALESTDAVPPAASAVSTVADQVTPLPQVTPTTTAKRKRSKKAKKNKKKKAVDTDGDFAYDIINGLLDFFN